MKRKIPVTKNEIAKFYHLPLMDLVRRASLVHAQNFPDGKIQPSALLSIKTGGCPENCSYCPQSAHHKTGVEKSGLMAKADVLTAAQKAKDQGATRFCLGAAWREVRDGEDFNRVLDMVGGVAEMGMEVCCTLGMLNASQAQRLKEAGLDFYNHNIDTSPEFYATIIQTRTFAERLETLSQVRNAGLSVCTGGILGMGESHDDRMGFIRELVNLEALPESITINTLVPSPGTPLQDQAPLDPLDVVRVIATLRIFSPKSMIRLSAGRMSLSDEAQFLCFLAGGNSIFLGEKLLTSPNARLHDDNRLMSKLGMQFAKPSPHAQPSL